MLLLLFAIATSTITMIVIAYLPNRKTRGSFSLFFFIFPSQGYFLLFFFFVKQVLSRILRYRRVFSIVGRWRKCKSGASFSLRAFIALPNISFYEMQNMADWFGVFQKKKKKKKKMTYRWKLYFQLQFRTKRNRVAQIEFCVFFQDQCVSCGLVIGGLERAISFLTMTGDEI